MQNKTLTKMQEQQLFDKYQEGKHWENHPTIYAERYAKFLKEQKFNGLLIDVGNGNGRDVAVFHQAGFKVKGIDYSPQEIAKAKQIHPRCNFEIGNVENLRFPNNSVGAYFMINVIHYVKKQQALDELYRTLQNGSYLYIHFNVDIVDTNGNVDYHHNEEEITDLVSRFNVVKKKKFERVDTIPKVHTHTILELILQKGIITQK